MTLITRIKATVLPLKNTLQDAYPTPLYGIALAVSIFLLNATYVSYPDEFINILGGTYINAGKLPYKDYFDHHMPLAWYLAAGIQLITRQSFVAFRIVWALFQALSLAGVGITIYRYKKSLSYVYALWMILYACVSMRQWLHLYLGDSLAALFFAMAFWLILAYDPTKPRRYILILSTYCVAAMIFSSLTYMYVAMGLYAWIVLSYLYSIPSSSCSWRNFAWSLGKLMLWCAAPYFLYGIYLFVTKTYTDFWFSNFTYNTTLYIAPSLKGSMSFNPIRFAWGLSDTFWGAYLTLLSQLAHPSFYFPLNRLVGLGSLLMLVWFWSHKPLQAFLLTIILTFSAPRSAQLSDMKQTDYQMGVFITMGTICAAYMLYTLVHKLDTYSFFIKFLRSVMLFFLILYASSTLAFGLYEVSHIRYERYMGTLPPISNLSNIADFITNITQPGDAYWVGPYEGNHAFFVKGRSLAGKYPSLLPQFRESEYLKTDFIKQFEIHKPKVVIFKHDASIFQTPAVEFGKFFLDWLKRDYKNCVEAKVICKSKVSDLIVHEDVYIRNGSEEIFEKL